MKVAIVDVHNGKGYSSPDIKTAEKSSVESLKVVQDMADTYGEEWKEIKTEGDAIMNFESNDGDYGAIHVILIPENKFSIIHVQPDICEASLNSSFDNVEDSIKELTSIVNGDINFDEDDVTDYCGELNFGSHNDNGFDYFEIVQG